MEWLSFRKFITPAVLQVIFWLGVLACIVMGVMMIVEGGESEIEWIRAAGTLGGVGVLLLGPFVWRIYVEMFILLFRIYDELRASE